MTIRIVRRRVSDGARTLKQALGCKMAKLSNWDRTYRSDRLLINWGNTEEFAVRRGQLVLNKPEAVKNAVEKRRTLRLLTEAGLSVPQFSATLPTKENRQGEIWIARTTTTGHSGQGIVVIREADDGVQAPLYTKYVKKKVELRMHVAGGVVIKVAQRKKRSGFEHTKDQLLIRSYDNGWVHTVNDVEDFPTDAFRQSVLAVQALGLDFGAVDLVVEKDTNNIYILEVNSAPGLSAPSVIEAYKEAFLGMYQ